MSLILDALRRSESGGVAAARSRPCHRSRGVDWAKIGLESSYWSAPGWVLRQGG